ncbi:hypothetical protein [Absidia glauca]|uniref:Uncharacterized protein n=1 Tax=Absidia glauca TaxID=4829 RepID=A0A163MQ86_ABSGL|nr:hypothetical protein [Absidia glauca]
MTMDLLYSIDRDLLFFFNSDDQHQHPLPFLKQKEQKQLGKLIKKVHHSITKLQRRTPDISSAATSRFYQQKQTKQLYIKLDALKTQYQAAMEHLQIRPLETDRERYEQLQVIHGLSGRLDRSSQVYEELHHLHRALIQVRQEWKLDQIQDIVSTLATTSPHDDDDETTLTDQHNHLWYASIDNTTENKRNIPMGLAGAVKNWLRQIGNRGKKETSTDVPPSHHKLRSRHHQHLVCRRPQQHIRQVIEDFQGVFEENARQNHDRMYRLYAPLFHPEIVDPLLAEDIQRLCLEISTAPPPSLASLHQPSSPSSGTTMPSFLTGVDEMQFWVPTQGRTDGSVCLGLLSEYLLQVGQRYYTSWINDIEKAQQQHTVPFQIATETLAQMYRALQIEQGYATLLRLCTQLEPSLP